MSNRIQYGFRFIGGFSGGSCYPNPVKRFVASDASFDVNGGAANVGLGPGDPVRELNDGSVTLCDGSEGSGGALDPWGIVVAVLPYWSVSEQVMRYGDVLPSHTVYGSNLARQSWVMVQPIHGVRWEVDADAGSAPTTKAGYQALIGANVDHVLTGGAGESRAKPLIDISSADTTGTLKWRIVGIADTENNRDFSEDRVKLVVVGNDIQHPAYNSTGI